MDGLKPKSFKATNNRDECTIVEAIAKRLSEEQQKTNKWSRLPSIVNAACITKQEAGFYGPVKTTC